MNSVHIVFLLLGILCSATRCRSSVPGEEVAPLVIDEPSSETRDAPTNCEAGGPTYRFHNVLSVDVDYLHIASDSLRIVNESGDLVGYFTGDGYVAGRQSVEYINGVLDYYPDYMVLHFADVVATPDEFLLPQCDGMDTLSMPRDDRKMRLRPWPEFIANVLLSSTVNNPLRVAGDSVAAVVPDFDYEAVHFEPLEVAGEWVRVRCNAVCEGCDGDETIAGWLRWREGGSLLVDLWYAC